MNALLLKFHAFYGRALQAPGHNIRQADRRPPGEAPEGREEITMNTTLRSTTEELSPRQQEVHPEQGNTVIARDSAPC
jgi:hypothetical protein